MIQIGQDYLRDSGFTQHQYIMFRHHDAGHPHLHILVNRIGYDGKVLSDSNDFARCEGILRRLEKKYNLAEVISSRQARERAITKNEMEMMKRTNAPSVKMWLQTTIKKALEDNPRMTAQEFIRFLENKGINLLFNQASTGYVSGISYGYDGFLVTGSKLGNDFKWTTIKNRTDYEQERDRIAIQQANDRTRSIKLESATEIGNRKGRTNPIPGKSKGLNLPGRTFSEGGESLLDGVSHRDNIDPDGLPYLDDDPLGLRRKRKKKRKGKGF
jgi:hypothetical protein